MTRPQLAIVGLTFALLASRGNAAKLAVVGGRVVTMAGRTWDPGVVLVSDGRITAVGGAELDVPAGYRRLDARGARVLPGMIDANTHLGLVEVDMEPNSKELGKISEADGARLRAIDGVFPSSELIPVTRLNGITSVLVSPGEQGIFSGQGAVIQLGGPTLREMLVKSPATLHVSLGASGSSGKPYSTRMSRMAHLRAAFLAAQEYERKRVRHEQEVADLEAEQSAAASSPTTGEAEPKKPERPPLPPARDLEKEALAAALPR